MFNTVLLKMADISFNVEHFLSFLLLMGSCNNYFKQVFVIFIIMGLSSLGT